MRSTRPGSRRARIQEEHRALAASLEAAAVAHTAAAAKLRADHAAEAMEQEVEHMARADNEAEQERRCLRQESAALTNTFESLEWAVARESAREAPLTVDKAGAETTVGQTKAKYKAVVAARGGGGGNDGAGGGARGAVAAVPRADPGGARALAASLEAAEAEAARGPRRWLSPQISTYCT